MAHGELALNNGKAVYALSDPMDPISDAFREVVRTEVMNAFKLRKMRTHKTFELNGPHITQHHADGVRIGLRLYTGPPER
jgi:hypothetical protein